MTDQNYTWDQQLDEVHIAFKLTDPDSPVNIKFSIINRKINLVYNGTTIIDGTLLKKIEAGTEYWARNEDTIDLYFNKKVGEWWESLLEGSEKVDVSKLAEESNADLGMLDPQAREMIEKMMYENRNKDESQLMGHPDFGDDDSCEEQSNSVKRNESNDEQNKSVEEAVVEEIKEDDENKIEEIKEEVAEIKEEPETQ